VESTEPTARPAAQGDEARFGCGAWLTLALAVAVLVGPLIITLAGADLPTDGWAHTTGDLTNRYRLLVNLTDRPSPLREGDVILAIDGEPLVFGYRSALPDDLQAGQTLRYTVLRDGQTLEVDAPLTRHSPRTVANYLVRSTQRDIVYPVVVPLLILLIVGFAFARRPGNEAARLLLLAFAYFAGGNWFGFANWDPFVYAYPAPLALASIVYFYGWAWLFFPALTHLTLVFPVRLWPLRRFPRLLPALLYGVTGLLTLLATPLAMAGRAEAGTLDNVAILGAVTLFVVTLFVGLIYNFRNVRDPVARAQLRWIALGLGLGWGVGITLNFLGSAMPAFQPLTEPLFAVLILLLPLSLAVAITRHRLFDIDVIINRALVYGSLTGALVVVYFGGVALLQGLFRALTGQTSNLAIVASTLIIAALFQPLRGRIQAFIDRRFFRRKYDAAKTLAAYGATLRDEADFERVSAGLLGAVQETVQPAHASLWWREPEELR
jgi:hypothetical protein